MTRKRKTSDCAICGKPNATFTIFTPNGPPDGLEKAMSPEYRSIMVHKKCVEETEDQYHWAEECVSYGNVCIYKEEKEDADRLGESKGR